MKTDITRREWLAGGTALAGSIVASQITSAQTVPTPNMNPTPQNPIRAGFNENVYGHSAKAKKVMLEAAEKAHLYDFFSQRNLKEVISKMENLPGDHIAIGNGSTPFLERAAYVCAIQQGKVLTSNPTYGSVPGTARALGVEVITVPVDENLSIDLEATRAAMTDDVKLIYFCNPNNPIPSIIEKTSLEEFCLEVSKKAMVVVDEAYYEYVRDDSYSTMAHLVKDNPNIIVLRTASKIHGFASVRVGFAFTHPDTMKKLMAFRSGTTSYPALMGAITSYKDTDYQKFVVDKNYESLEILYKMFEELRHNLFFQT